MANRQQCEVMTPKTEKSSVVFVYRTGSATREGLVLYHYLPTCQSTYYLTDNLINKSNKTSLSVMAVCPRVRPYVCPCVCPYVPMLYVSVDLSVYLILNNGDSVNGV